MLRPPLLAAEMLACFDGLGISRSTLQAAGVMMKRNIEVPLDVALDSSEGSHVSGSGGLASPLSGSSGSSTPGQPHDKEEEQQQQYYPRRIAAKVAVYPFYRRGQLLNATFQDVRGWRHHCQVLEDAAARAEAAAEAAAAAAAAEAQAALDALVAAAGEAAGAGEGEQVADEAAEMAGAGGHPKAGRTKPIHKTPAARRAEDAAEQAKRCATAAAAAAHSGGLRWGMASGPGVERLLWGHDDVHYVQAWRRRKQEAYQAQVSRRLSRRGPAAAAAAGAAPAALDGVGSTATNSSLPAEGASPAGSLATGAHSAAAEAVVDTGDGGAKVLVIVETELEGLAMMEVGP
jgi:hypothetical protein